MWRTKEQLGEEQLGRLPLRDLSSEASHSDSSSDSSPIPLEQAGPQREWESFRTGVIEEGSFRYHHGGLHPVYIGELYGGKYIVRRKLGYGNWSTVWLVEDLTQPADVGTRFRALKILKADAYTATDKCFEREILTYLREGDRSHPGYDSICHLVDDFELSGRNGTHVCLVFELMGECLSTFRLQFDDRQIPSDVMRKLTKQLVLALDYAHGKNVIHTDIHLYNIFVKFIDTSRIMPEYFDQNPAPFQNRDEQRYTPILSQPLRDHYYPLSKKFANYDFTLGDWGSAHWTNRRRGYIQPLLYRSPEVVINAPWGKPTDWWNLGAVLFVAQTNFQMFQHTRTRRGHVAEMYHFFGPFPVYFLAGGGSHRLLKIFDWEDSERPGMVKAQYRLRTARNCLLPDEWWPFPQEPVARAEFTAFIRLLMRIEPKRRPTADEILMAPWLHGVQIG
ncbi:serine-threonineeeee protein kinase [Podospora aff. communis PSN243]|uniref:non-specific serine/threonine protein kinase n=1 Tax=Podospora aff. communis PSN243 TaxID=3040156 RepID=A0AAV9GRA8_9PEZI|nr:serine-threonineeeee protein kinase [Podospora aff. communis PSN243]